MQKRWSLRLPLVSLLSRLLFLLAASPCLGEDAVRQGVAAKINFLEPEAAREAIVDDAADGYFSRLTELEMAAKTGAPVSGETREARIKETRRRYQEGVRAFTEPEKEALQWYISRLDPILRERYPRLAALPWSFIKVSPSVEAGFPHTRGPHIILAEPMLAALVAMKENDVGGAAVRRMGPLLLHEQLHVFQRKEPELFEDLYARVWKFRRAPEIAGAKTIEERMVVNPDGPDAVWIFPVGKGEWVWPLIVFPEGMNEERARLGRMQMVIVEVEATEGGGWRVKADEGGAPIIRPLRTVDVYMNAFFPSEYVFHPNEASADLFARIVAYDSLGAREDVPEDQRERIETGVGPIRKWYMDKLGK